MNSPSFPLSVLLTSLPLAFEEAVRQVAALGFSRVDVVARSERPPEHLEALAEAGVIVSCAAVGRNLPDGMTLDSASMEMRRGAVEEMKRHIADAARLGATSAYIIPGMEGSVAGLARFAEACGLLADYAAGRMVRLHVEHIPGRALPTVAATLAWLKQVNHDNVSLLLDIGHCLISGEDAAEAVRLAGRRLGYVHLDDNDGVGDLHWPLLAGRLTEESLRRFLEALRAGNYRGPLTLEFNPQNPDPVAALTQAKTLLERLDRAEVAG
jgi:sugar phosphate isomerase/epimerase